AAFNLLWIIPWLWVSKGETRRSAAAAADRKGTPWWALARRMVPVTSVDFCYGWTLWLFLSWIPSFFFETFHLDLKGSALFSSGVFTAGVVGDLVGGVATDYLLKR